jgi:hypothetical protein
MFSENFGSICEDECMQEFDSFKDAKSRKDSIEESKACLLASCTGMMLTCKRKKKC